MQGVPLLTHTEYILDMSKLKCDIPLTQSWTAEGRQEKDDWRERHDDFHFLNVQCNQSQARATPELWDHLLVSTMDLDSPNSTMTCPFILTSCNLSEFYDINRHLPYVKTDIDKRIA